jgi:hypothetical protein
MARGLFLAFILSALVFVLLGRTGAFANGGAFAGYEPFVLASVAMLSVAVFYVASRAAALSTGKLIAGLATAGVLFPLLLLFGPLLFCVAFLPNARCM